MKKYRIIKKRIGYSNTYLYTPQKRVLFFWVDILFCDYQEIDKKYTEYLITSPDAEANFDGFLNFIEKDEVRDSKEK